MRVRAAAAVVLAAVACSHVVYQYRPNGQEAQALDEAALRLAAAAEARDGSIVEEDVDLDARRAMFELTVHIARKKVDAGSELDALAYLFALLAVPLKVPGPSDTPVLEELAPHAGEIAKKQAAELAPVLPEAVDGGTGSAIADMAAGIRTHAQETSRDYVRRILEGAFVEEQTACHSVRKASLRGEMFRHLDDEPKGRAWQTWKPRVLAVHLYWIRCSERDAVAIFQEYEDRPRPGLAAWRFFSHPESARVEARIERALAQ
jgi:hypothetical protein